MKSISLLFISLFLILGCNKKKQEQPLETTNKIQDTLAAEKTNNAIEEVEEENINDEDYGDPGLEGLVVDKSTLKSEVTEFLSKLSKLNIKNTIEDKGFIIVKPGPGVHPVYSFGKSIEDILSVDEVMLYLPDSSALLTSTIYRLVHDKCTVIDGFPDGIYYGDIDFKTITLESYVDEDINKELQTKMQLFKNKTGNEFIIKFTTKAGEQMFLHLLTYLKNDALFIAIVDQRDCSA